MRSLAASPIGGRGETSASWTASPHPVSTARRGSNRARRSRRPTSRRCRVRQRAAVPRKGSSEASEDSSAPAERGRLRSSSPSAATTEVTAIHRASSGAIHQGARARATRRAARRRAALDAVATATPGPVRMRAAGDTTTRRPRSWARQPRSRSAATSPKVVSHPRSATRRSRSTRLPGERHGQGVAVAVVLALVGLARRRSGSSRPPRVARMASARRRCGSSASRCLGPTRPVDGERRHVSTRTPRAPGSGSAPTGSTQARVGGAVELVGEQGAVRSGGARTGRRARVDGRPAVIGTRGCGAPVDEVGRRAGDLTRPRPVASPSLDAPLSVPARSARPRRRRRQDRGRRCARPVGPRAGRAVPCVPGAHGGDVGREVGAAGGSRGRPRPGRPGLLPASTRVGRRGARSAAADPAPGAVEDEHGIGGVRLGRARPRGGRPGPAGRGG